MPNLREFSKPVSVALAAAVLVVSVCAARCVAPVALAAMPCHGEPVSQGPCASLSSQAWVLPPDATGTLLALALLLAVALIFFAPALPVLATAGLRPLPVRSAAPPPRLARSSFSPRGPPRR